jgi:SRSO17 transposase
MTAISSAASTSGVLAAERLARLPGARRKYYLTSRPSTASLRMLASAIKARWACEQAHQQTKEELGLDHFEGRSRTGLHHHALPTMVSFAFLEHYRLAHLHHRLRRRRRAARRARGKIAARRPPQVPRRTATAARGSLTAAHLPTLRHAHLAAS